MCVVGVHAAVCDIDRCAFHKRARDYYDTVHTSTHTTTAMVNLIGWARKALDYALVSNVGLTTLMAGIMAVMATVDALDARNVRVYDWLCLTAIVGVLCGCSAGYWFMYVILRAGTYAKYRATLEKHIIEIDSERSNAIFADLLVPTAAQQLSDEELKKLVSPTSGASSGSTKRSTGSQLVLPSSELAKFHVVANPVMDQFTRNTVVGGTTYVHAITITVFYTLALAHAIFVYAYANDTSGFLELIDDVSQSARGVASNGARMT